MAKAVRYADPDYLRRLFIKAENGGFWTHHHHGVDPAPPQRKAQGVYVVPQVNASRWLVLCPACASAQLAAPEIPLFFCVECLNTHVQGRWLDVRWPSASERAAIEKALAARPNPNTRGWEPNEDIGKLVVENMAHGLIDHDAGTVLGDPGPEWHGILPARGDKAIGTGGPT